MPLAIDRHPTDEELEHYALNVLPEDDSSWIEEHLLICSACQDRLRETDDFIRATQTAARRLRAAPPSVLRVGIARVAALPAAPACAAAAGVAAVVLLMVARPALMGPAGGEPVSVVLEAVRGYVAGAPARAPAGRAIDLRWDAAQVPPPGAHRIEIVDRDAARVYAAELNGRSSLRWPAPRSRGRYWIRLYGPPPESELLREFGLELE